MNTIFILINALKALQLNMLIWAGTGYFGSPMEASLYLCFNSLARGINTHIQRILYFVEEDSDKNVEHLAP